MSNRRRRLIRHSLVVGLSLLAHGAVLGWLIRSASIDLFETARPSPLLSVELVRPGRLDSRPARSPATAAPTALMRKAWQAASSVEVPPLSAPTATAGGLPGNVGPASGDGSAPDKLQAALRARLGCAGSAGRSLSREEREKCLERLGRLSLTAPSYDAPMDPAKHAYFDEVAAAGPSGSVSQDPTPGAVTPGSAHVTVFKCSVLFGVGRKPKDRQGTLRPGGGPCAVPLQGGFFTPEANVRKR